MRNHFFLVLTNNLEIQLELFCHARRVSESLSFSLFKSLNICLEFSCRSCHWLLSKQKSAGQTVLLYMGAYLYVESWLLLPASSPGFFFSFSIILNINFAVLAFNEPWVEKKGRFWDDVCCRWWLLIARGCWSMLAHSQTLSSGWGQLRLKSHFLKLWIMKAAVFRVSVRGIGRTFLLYADFSTFHIRN